MPSTSCTRYTTASSPPMAIVTTSSAWPGRTTLVTGSPSSTRSGLPTSRVREGDLPLGSLAIPVRWFLMNSHLDDDPLAPATVRSFLRAADRVGRGVAQILDNVRPDVVLLLNGLFFFEAITWELSDARGSTW